MPNDVVTMDKIVALCKRRGLIFPASEIYGGIGNTYDYGHYGVLLKNNVKDAWWRAMVFERDDVVALDSAIIQHPQTWEASGHLGGFSDPLVECLGKCKQRFRADHLQDEVACPLKPSKHPGEFELRPHRAARVQPDVRDARRPGARRRLGRLPAPRDRAGHLPQLQEHAPVRAQEAAVRDRPGRQVVPQRDHGAQLHLPHARVRADGDGVLRPARRGAASGTSTGAASASTGTSGSASAPTTCGCARTTADELSHYSSGTSDVEYLFPIGWSELEGIANRGDFDLSAHAAASGKKLNFKDANAGVEFVPHVIEPAAGADRAVLAFLCDAYDEDEIGGEQRTVLRLHPRSRRSRSPSSRCCARTATPSWRARSTRRCASGVAAEYDDGGNIGKRYRRQDEIGTPFGVTIDHQSLEDGTVTLRDRDSLAQERLPIEGLADELARRVAARGRLRSVRLLCVLALLRASAGFAVAQEPVPTPTAGIEDELLASVMRTSRTRSTTRSRSRATTPTRAATTSATDGDYVYCAAGRRRRRRDAEAQATEPEVAGSAAGRRRRCRTPARPPGSSRGFGVALLLIGAAACG